MLFAKSGVNLPKPPPFHTVPNMSATNRGKIAFEIKPLYNPALHDFLHPIRHTFLNFIT